MDTSKSYDRLDDKSNDRLDNEIRVSPELDFNRHANPPAFGI